MASLQLADSSPRLELRVLGGLDIRRAGRPLAGLASRKAEALLVYLARNPRPIAREALADLFWDDRSRAQALGNLRVLLAALRPAVGEALLISRQSVEFDRRCGAWVDANELDTAAAALPASGRADLQPELLERLGSAMNHYRGDFLHGIYVRSASGFEEWAALEREQLRQAAIAILDALVAAHTRRGDYARGQTAAARLLSLDPMREASHRLAMRLHARHGQLSAALAQYDACRRVLEAELGVEPGAETQALYRLLREEAPASTHNLPATVTPFWGREAELEQVTSALEARGRLVTIAGPAGAGKTRLALRAAEQRVGAHLHGVRWVALGGQPASASALFGALGQPPTSSGNTLTSLLRLAAGRDLLLLLDGYAPNPEAQQMLAALHGAAPNLSVLVTAQQPLGLSGEHVIALNGLPVPTASGLDPAALAEVAAVQLFIHSARRTRPTFSLDPDNMTAVLRLCRALAGLPRAIEQAAAWLRTLSIYELADEVERDPALLGGALAGPPESAAVTTST